MEEPWDIIPGPVNDKALHFVLNVPVVNAQAAVKEPVEGVTYGSIQLNQKPMLLETLNGVAMSTFKLQSITKSKPQFLEFRFAHQATDAQTTPFRSYPDQRPFTWPMVIRKTPNFAIDQANPRVVEVPSASVGGTARTVYLPRGYVEFEYKPETSRFTDVTIEEFVSATPWTRQQLRNTQPLPMPVEWDWYGVRESYVCLHPKLEVPPQLVGGLEGDRDGVPPNIRDGVVFDETNHTDWSRFSVYEQDYVPASGEYKLTKITYHPPAQEWLRK